MNTLGALGVGKKQSNDSIFKKIITNSIKETSLFQRGVALKKMITTGEDPRALMGLDRGFKGLGGYLPMQSGADAFKEQAKNRNILGKGTTLTPGGALAYLGLNKVVGGITKKISGKQADFTKEGSGAYGVTQIAGDILADTLASPGGGKSVANIAKLPSKGIQKLRNLKYSIQDEITRFKQSGLSDRFIQYTISPRISALHAANLRDANIPLPTPQYRPKVAYERGEYAKFNNEALRLGMVDPVRHPYMKEYPGGFFEEAGANKYARDFLGVNKLFAPTVPRMIRRKIFGEPFQNPFINKATASIESVKNIPKNIKTKFQDFFVPPKTVSSIGKVNDTFLDPEAFQAAIAKAENDAMARAIRKANEEWRAKYDIRMRVQDNLIEFQKGRGSGFLDHIKQMEDIARAPYITQAQGFGLKAEDLESLISHPQFVNIMKTMSPKAIRTAITTKFGIVHRGSGVDNTMGIGRHSLSVWRPDTRSPYAQLGSDIGDDADFNFYVDLIRDSVGNPMKDASGQVMRHIDISEMYSTGGLAGQRDMMRMLAYIFDEIIVKHNIVSVSNGSFSKHSLALAKSFAEITKILRPQTKINFPEIQLGTRLNGAEMSDDLWRNMERLEPDSFENFFTGTGEGIRVGGGSSLQNMATTAGQRARIEQLVQMFMKIRKQLKLSGVDIPSSRAVEAITSGAPIIPNPIRTPTYNAGPLFDDPNLPNAQQFLDDLPPYGYRQRPANDDDINYDADFYNGGLIPYAKGGLMKYGNGGPTFGPMNMGIPATLHGGEFVVRKKAVDKYGMDMLSKINEGLYAPKVPSLKIPMANYSKIANAGSSQQISTSESNHNYNFYVDNFIGETEWFNTMMREYNVKVVPANQKQAGLESRVVKSYNGINRGM